MIYRKIEEFLFYLLIIAIPFNLRKILYYPGWRFNEWQSISIYFTDLLFAVLLFFWLINRYQKILYYVLRITYYGKNLRTLIQNTKYIIQRPSFYLVVFVIIALISLKEINDIKVGFYHWFKLLEFSLFYFYLKNYAFIKFDHFKSLLALLIGGFFQAVIAISQFVRQSSIGLSIFGEGVLDPSMGSVAAFYNSVGEKIMRGYGTTPHSNVLAGYLLLVILGSYFLWTRYIFYFPDKKPKITFLILFSTVIFGFLTSFSRTTVFIWVLASFIFTALVYFNRKDLIKSTKALIICGIVTLFIFGGLFFDESLSRLKLDKNEEAFQLRIYFADQSLSLEKADNIFGIGWGNFVPWLMEKNPNKPEWLYQPVHNIYLLVYSETGILGFLSFCLFLFFIVLQVLKSKNVFMFLCLFAFMFIAFFDHYFLTLQQGNLIWWGVLGTFCYLNKDG